MATTTTMRSPERARRLFDSTADDSSASAASPPTGANVSSGSKQSTPNSGQKRARRSSASWSTPSSPSNAHASVAAASRSFLVGPNSPSVAKTLFVGRDDSSSSDTSSCDADNDIKDRTTAHPCQARHLERSNTLDKEDRAASPSRRRRKRLQRSRVQSQAPPTEPIELLATDPQSRDGGVTPPYNEGPQLLATTARKPSLPAFHSPELRTSTLLRKARAGPRPPPIISPHVKGLDPDATGAPTVRSRAIASVLASPLHSPTTGRLSKHMTTNLSMASPVQLEPRTPPRHASNSPCTTVDRIGSRLPSKLLRELGRWLTDWCGAPYYLLTVCSPSRGPRPATSACHAPSSRRSGTNEQD